MTMLSTVEDTNHDTMVTREEKLPEYVKLITLKPGDEFETESSGGTVKWVVNNGHAKGVAVVFDGCKTEVSIAPSLMVKIRKLAQVYVPDFAALDLAETEPITETAVSLPECGCDESVGYVCEECARASMGLVDLPTVAPVSGDFTPVICEEWTMDVPAAPVPEDRVHRIGNTPEQDKVEFPAPVPGAPVVKIIRIVVPTVPAAVTPAKVTPPKPADPVIHKCKFDLSLTTEQINLLHFPSASALFCYGLYQGWSKDTFFAACKAKFPELKCGQDFEACVRQINLNRSLLRRSGKAV